MAKEIIGIVKLQIKGANATPSPPIGPALGAKGVSIMEFCKQFNARTQNKAGKIIPVIITVFADKTFEFITKSPPVVVQIKEIANLKSGSAEPNRKKVADITWEQVREIANEKMQDMNSFEIESAMSMVAGTARSMGVTIKGERPF